MFISLTVSWISGFPSRSMPRSQLTGGTVRPTNPCSLVSLNTVRNMLQHPHTLPVSACRHTRSSSSSKRPTSVTDMVFKLDEEDTRRLQQTHPTHFCCHRLIGVAMVIAARSWQPQCVIRSVIDGWFHHATSVCLCVCTGV